MRIFSWTIPWFVVFCATTAWGQYGLYGSPEVLRLPPLSGPPAETSYLPLPAPPVAPAVVPWQTLPNVPAVAAQPLLQTVAITPSGPTVVPTPAPNPAFGPAVGMPVPTAQPRPGPVEQMLQQAYPATNGSGYVNSPGHANGYGCVNGYGCANGVTAGGCGPVSGPANQFAAAAACGDCGTADCGTPCCCSWYGDVSLLCMTRNRANRVYTTYETGNNPNQLMHTDVDMDWRTGGEIRLGHWFCCGQYAVEGVFWGLTDFEGTNYAVSPNGVSTPLAVDGIEFAGDNAVNYFDGAAVHRLWRRSKTYNAEVNFLRRLVTGCCESPFQMSCLAGFRYFRLTDEITFGSLRFGGTWCGNGGRDAAYLSDKITNDLYGLQIGLDGSYAVAPRWRVFCGAKFGVFENHIQNTFAAYRGDGTVACPTAASGMHGSYPVHGSADVVSFMTELKIGLNWNFCRNWGAQVGYRVVALTEVGFSDAQIPFYVVDIPELMSVKHNGDLLLHGAFAGITWNF